MTKYNVLIDISVELSCVDDTYRGSYLSVLQIISNILGAKKPKGSQHDSQDWIRSTMPEIGEP
jgi:hypothetical protein